MSSYKGVQCQSLEGEEVDVPSCFGCYDACSEYKGHDTTQEECVFAERCKAVLFE